jgi:hypothetical protein
MYLNSLGFQKYVQLAFCTFVNQKLVQNNIHEFF